jgi:GNAT superfamily N-acetyltransferase
MARIVRRSGRAAPRPLEYPAAHVLGPARDQERFMLSRAVAARGGEDREPERDGGVRVRKLEVRSAVAEDAPAVAGLLAELGYPQPDVETVVQRLRDMAGRSSVRVLVAVAHGEVVGVASLQEVSLLHDRRPLGRLSTMVVTERWRGRGVGRALVEALEELARGAGCGRMEVTSNLRRAAAHAFYQRLGYEDRSKRFVKRL